jgi:hypothetical protein
MPASYFVNDDGAGALISASRSSIRSGDHGQEELADILIHAPVRAVAKRVSTFQERTSLP